MSKRPGYPPTQPGETFLVHLPRGRSLFLRLVVGTYVGRLYVSLRLWKFSSRLWKWLPSKTVGCSVRRSELEPVIAALLKARDVMGEPPIEGAEALAKAPAHPRRRLPRKLPNADALLRALGLPGKPKLEGDDEEIEDDEEELDDFEDDEEEEIEDEGEGATP